MKVNTPSQFLHSRHSMRHFRTRSSSSSYSQPLFFFLFFLLLLVLFSSSFAAKPEPTNYENKSHASAILVFGDSTVDSGNNNYIKTIFKSNFPPYGQDFEGRAPTGRFCNGRLTTDFIASYIGVKENVPPYLDPNLGIDELMSGVSFASAGSGFDPLTPTIGSVLDLPTQLEYFREYKRKIEKKIGKQKMQKHIEEAAFFVSAGTNDFVINYFTLPTRRKTFTIEAYQQFVMHNLKQFIQGLWEEGARRIGVAGLPPMGCLPVVITIFSADAVADRRCIDRFSAVARYHNFFLQNELNFLQMSLAHLGSKIFYIDIYTPLSDMIYDFRKYGFDDVNSGCCGTGYLETAVLCNPDSYICSDTSRYVFFDSIHPSEKTYDNVFKSARPVIDMIVSD